MKKKLILLLLVLCYLPVPKVNAQDFVLEKNKAVTGSYAGTEEGVYNYYQIIPSKNGFIAISATTSDGKDLLIDICDANKNIIATDVSIVNNEKVLHKVAKKTVYYLRIKGTPDITYTISYKEKNFDKLSYAKKYSYTFTNASFNNKSNAIVLKIKSSMNGNLTFMCKTENPLMAQYLNNKKKVISNNCLLAENNLSGIGVNADKVYYIRLWNSEESVSGTTTIKNMKYQIKGISKAKNSSRESAANLSKNTYKESLVPANKKNTYWYRIKLTSDQKLSVYVESRMLQMNGSCLQLDLYNRDGKKITSKSIEINEEAYAIYKKKKYRMNYPVKSITTGNLPEDTYYIRIVSKSKKTSGSFRVKWN